MLSIQLYWFPYDLAGKTILQGNHVAIPERFIEIFGVEVVNAVNLFSALGEVLVKKIGQDADAIDGPDMGFLINVKRTDLQEGLNMLEGVLDLGLIPVSADDLLAGKNEGLVMAIDMIGDKDTQTVQSFGQGDFIRLLLN